MPIDSGKLDKRITIQQPRESTHGGEVTRVWEDLATVWAEMIPLKSDESVDAEQLASRITHRLRIRYRPDLTITSRMRLKYGSRELHIVGPPRNPRERNEELIIDCKEDE